MRSKTVERVGIGIAVALGIVALVGIASVTSIYRFAQTTRELSRMQLMLTQIQGVLLRLSEAESGQRGYVLAGDPINLRLYNEAVLAVDAQVEALRAQAFADSTQRQRLELLNALAERRVQLMREVVELRGAGSVDDAAARIMTGNGRIIMDSIRTVARAFEQSELDGLATRSAHVAANARIAIGLIAGGSLFAFLVVLGSAVVIRRDSMERRRAEWALRDSETLLSQFMENLPIGVVVVDTASRLRFANNAAVHLAGQNVLLDAGQEPLPLVRAGSGEAYPAEETPIARALAGRAASLNDAELHSDGRALPVEVSAAPIYDASGRIAYAIAAFKDITERRRSEEALRSAKETAETANRTKSEFLARMSHELRTPLNSVIGFANVLLRNRTGNLRQQDITYLERILENGKHLLLLINDILDLSKIEAGKIEVELETVELDTLLRGVVAQFESQTKGGAVALKLDVPAQLAPLRTDPARLQQVLFNLVGNGLKFAERGSVEVRVEADAEGRARRVLVRDTGIGIAPNRLDAIFDVFEQAESTISRKYGGTGLGLPISRAICELLGYTLSVSSEPRVGSVFTIDLRPDGAPRAVETAAGAAADA